MFANRLLLLRLLTLSLLIVTPLGFLSKFYTGPARQWVNHYAGDVLYEIFWCLVIFWFIPKKKAIATISVWVFSLAC